MGTLNAFHEFKAPALAPGAMNLFMILALAGLCPFLGESPEVQVKGLAAGVIAGGIAQLAIQLPPLFRLGYRPRFILDWKDPEVRKIGGLMLPGLVGIGVTEINALVDTVIGSLLEEGSVAALEYGLRLIQLPLGVIGVALGTASLPTLSRQAARGDFEGLRETYSFVLRMILFLMAPAMVVLLCLATPIVQLLFQRGNFHAGSSTSMTAQAIVFFALGLLFYGAAKVTAPVFFSLHDTKTPVRCAVAALLSNIVLNLLLMGPMRLGGLALATSLSAGLNVFLLIRALRRRLRFLRGKEIAASFVRIASSSLIMAVVILLTSLFLNDLTDSMTTRFLRVGLPIATGTLAFGLATFFLRSPELRFVADTLLVRRGRGRGTEGPS
jgi:putative peptidoglycan lipid II flippase